MASLHLVCYTDCFQVFRQRRNPEFHHSLYSIFSDASRQHGGSGQTRTHDVRQNRCEVEGVGVDTFPLQIVRTRGSPTLVAARVCNLVGKGGRNSQEEAGEDTHADGEMGGRGKGRTKGPRGMAANRRALGRCTDSRAGNLLPFPTKSTSDRAASLHDILAHKYVLTSTCDPRYTNQIMSVFTSKDRRRLVGSNGVLRARGITGQCGLGISPKVSLTPMTCNRSENHPARRIRHVCRIVRART